MDKKTVYLLEDDKAVTEVVKLSLEISNIECIAFGTIKEFKEALKRESIKICLLDIMLPDGSGIDLLNEIKAVNPKCICIMLSALGSEVDKVKALNLGADDYISKPFGTMELIARINAHLRRLDYSKYEVGNLKINKDRHEVYLEDKELKLNKKEFDLLVYFVENPNIVISREKLLEEVWGYFVGETRTVDNHILRLRKLGIDQIETIFGVGYKFNTFGE